MNKNTLLLLVVILVCAVGIRVADHVRTNYWSSPDTTAYSMNGAKLAETGTYGWARDYNFRTAGPVLFPLVIAGVLTIVPGAEPFLVAKCLSAAFGVLAVILTFWFVRRATYDSLALIAAGIMAVYTDLLVASATGTTETFMVCLVLGVALCMTYYESVTASLLAGVLIALGTMLRTEGLLLLVVPVVIVLLRWLMGEERNASKSFVLTLVAFVIVMTPYVLFMMNEGVGPLGDRSALQATQLRGVVGVEVDMIVYGLNENLTGVNNARRDTTSLVSLWLANPIGELQSYGKEWVLQATYLVVIGGALFSFVLLMFFFITRPDKDECLVTSYALLIFAAVLLFVYPALFSSQRHMMLPCVLLFVASFSFITRVPKHWLIVAVIVSLVLIGVRDVRYGLRDMPSHEESWEVGEWIATQCDGHYSCVVMSHSAWPAYHARQEHLPLPYANNTNILVYARYHNATFIVIERRVLDEWSIIEDLWRLNEEKGVWTSYESNTIPRVRVFALSNEGDVR